MYQKIGMMLSPGRSRRKGMQPAGHWRVKKGSAKIHTSFPDKQGAHKMSSFLSLEGKCALVTGGARGIGRSIVQLLAQRGAEVAIADVLIDEAKQTAAEISQSSGQRILALPLDVRQTEAAKAVVDQVIAELGKLDILVNNAGVTRDDLIMRMGEEDWDLVLDVNLKGAWNCAKAVVRPMMKQRSGRIINLTSVSGLAGQAGQSNYSSSKAGLVGLTKSLARELASRNITVNAVAPGLIPTPLTEDLPQDLKDALIEAIPLGRLGTTQEIAAAVVFLASDEAAYITGQVLSIDGGMVMM
jgi:3-oxoacyl-[acyl-carrier protein] reductase